MQEFFNILLTTLKYEIQKSARSCLYFFQWCFVWRTAENPNTGNLDLFSLYMNMICYRIYIQVLKNRKLKGVMIEHQPSNFRFATTIIFVISRSTLHKDNAWIIIFPQTISMSHISREVLFTFIMANAMTFDASVPYRTSFSSYFFDKVFLNKIYVTHHRAMLL